MSESLPDDRLTIYRIPADTVRFVIAIHEDEQTMADATMPPGLYIRDPLRSADSSQAMFLVPIEHRTMYYSYRVIVANVARFATVFVPERNCLSCPSPDSRMGAGSAAGGFFI